MNQLIFLAVDGTDFATVESGITASDFDSGMTKKFFGVNHGGSAAMTSGSISKAVSLVRSGVFRQTLKAAECNYDFVLISFKGHASMADLTFPLQMVTNDDSDIVSLISDVESQLRSQMSALMSDVQSQASDLHSDLRSYLVALSDQLSDAHSDLKSDLSNVHSDLTSQIGDIATTALTVSDVSDIASRVWSEKYGAHSLASSFGSLFSLMATGVDNAESRSLRAMSDTSDLVSRITKTVASQSLLSDVRSDLRSQISGITASVSASDISDIASRVWSEKYAAHSLASSFGSLFSLMATGIDNAESRTLRTMSDTSDLVSRVTKTVASQSLLSDVHSDLRSQTSGITASVSASDISDIASRVWSEKYAAHSLASSFGSLFSLMATGVDNAESRTLRTMSDTSDLVSRITKTVASQSLLSDVHSDLRSQVSGITASVSASDISDIASRVWSEKYADHSLASSFGSLFSVMATGIDNAESRTLRTMSDTSDLVSRITKEVANNSQLSDIGSDLRSVMVALSAELSSAESNLQSQISDAQSDLRSYLVAMSGALSDVESQLDATNNALSDVESQLDAGVSVLASSMSDIASRVWATAGVDPTGVPAVTATMSAKIDWLCALARNKMITNSAVQSLRNDADAADIASAALADDGTDFTRSEWT